MLKSLFLLAAVAVIVGRVKPEQRADTDPRNQGLPLLFNRSRRKSCCGLAGNATPITRTGLGTAMLHQSRGGSAGTYAKAGSGWIFPDGKRIRHGNGATN